MPKAKKQPVKVNNPTDDPKVTVHAKLSADAVKSLDQIAEANGIPRAAVIAIACSRLIKTGI